MKYTETINMRITKKEMECIKRNNINISNLFREALHRKMIMSKEMAEQVMIDKISNALNMKITDLIVLPQTSDSTIIQFRIGVNAIHIGIIGI